MSLKTDLVGEYVKIPSEGDAGWIRVVFNSDSTLYVFVERDNPSRDMKVYFAKDIVATRYRNLS